MPTTDTMVVALEGCEKSLRVTGFSGTEGISQLFELHLSLICDVPIAAEDFVGKKMALTVFPREDNPRHYHGIVSRCSMRANEASGSVLYRVVVVPKVWLLQQRADCRIFQEQTAPDIIKKVLEGAGLAAGADFKISLQGTYEKREYCVQYRESDFNYISRLMEEEGIFYFFEHDEDKDLMVVADRKSIHAPIVGDETIVFIVQKGALDRTDCIWDFAHRQEIRTGKWTARDYNFKKPALLLEGVNQSAKHTDLEVYEYPGGHASPDQVKDLARIRIEEAEVQVKTATASSNSPRLTSGQTFTLAEHPIEALNIKYLLTSVSHVAGGSEDAGDASNYTCALTCIPATVQFRPTRTTPPSIVKGLQTAVVTGPPGEEIHTDEHGRIKVHFHWDRLGKKDENSSCWMRVSTTSAGKGWGILQLPRIGHEVIVDFLEGDPDRPIVTGCVYNGENKVAGSLPADKATSGMKSASTPGSAGFNQVFITDTANKEMISIHGQKDMTTTIEHDDTLTVGNNRSSVIVGNDTEAVTGDQTISIGGKQIIAIGNNQDIIIGANQTLNIKANQTITVGGRRLAAVKGNDELHVGGNRVAIVKGGNFGKTGGAETLEVGGAQRIKVSGAIKITSGAGITLQVGGSAIVIDAGGIHLTAPVVSTQAAQIHHNT